ncbi:MULTISPECIES: hypothetical protein [unclassified Bradyrhizobium]|uniref:hypothetical protein n=2 Tax=unclassified Bradyrhizobium TaxID=2631580 RepID=UPI0028ED38B1|nr:MULTISPECIES: hypothetical protein [unclassified Bradyrhizobium]
MDMSAVDLFREARGAIGLRAIRRPHPIKTLRGIFRTIHAAIAAAKLRRLRNELLCRRSSVASPSLPGDARVRPRSPQIVDDKGSF